MDGLMTVLPILLYILGSILLVILIILGIKLINTMNKIENVVDDINVKVSKLNGLFSVVDLATDSLSMLSDKLIDGIAGLFGRLFTRKSKKRKVEEEDE